MNKNVKKLTESPAYRLAFIDDDFMCSDIMRGTRLETEYNKVEYSLQRQGVKNTIVVFGSARAKETDSYYKEARKLAGIVVKHCSRRTSICTGGGPGIMEAANRGAIEAGGKSIGLNIELPHEQFPNPYISPELCFNFNYFAIRKMHFLRRARCLLAFPGGFGTLDEVFEALTLIQTKRIKPIPIVLFDKNWWQNIINFNALIESKAISSDDLDLFSYAHSAEEAWERASNHECFNLK